jgi:hypothetical protein
VATPPPPSPRVPRQQLQGSELLRQRSHEALHELRQEFEGLVQGLAPALGDGKQRAAAGGLPAVPQGGQPALLGSPAAVHEGLMLS